MRAWWLLAFARFAGAAPDLLFHAPDGRVPTFAPRPPVPNPVDDPDWLVAASGFCSDFSFAPDGSIDFKFHPEVSVAFTDAPFHQAASLEDGIEIRGEEYSQTDVLAAGTWTNKNIALLEPTSSCDDPPAGSQDEWAVSVFKVTGNEACGEECVHFSGLVSGASDNFVARKEGRFLCQLFVESHTFPDQARRSLRRRLAPTPLMTNMHMQPTARQPAFAPVPDIDLTASWLVATAGICSDLSVTPKSEMVAAESDADQSGTFIADIEFQFHPETSVAYTKSPDRGAVEIGDDGVVLGDKTYTAVDVLSAAVWDLKNIALLEPTSSCDDPPARSQDEWAISVLKVNSSDKCGAECVLYSGRVSASSSSLDVSVQKKGRFPCQLYVDSTTTWAAPPRPPPPPPPLLNFKAGDVEAVVVQLCQSYAYQTTGLFQRCVAGSTATENSLHNLCYNTSVGVLPSLAPLDYDVCGSDYEFITAANEYLAPFSEMNDWAREVNCFVNENLWGGKDDVVEAKHYPFVALKLEVYNATCDRSSPKVTVEMGSCIIADCPSSDDAAVKCFDRSSMTCTDYLAGVEWDLADDETCCESRRETFNCTEPPGEPPTYSMDGKLRKDGYTKPYIRLEDFERFVDPDSEDWGKLVISWDIAYIREATGLTDDKEGVFVRGIAAYLEGATVGDNIEDPDEIIVTLTATGEMTNQVKIPDRCSAASCRFDNYPFSGAPSGQAYCYTDDDGNPVCNEYNTLKYQARYQNTKGGPGAGCQYYGNPKPVFTKDKPARDRPDDCGKLDACFDESLECPCYCTDEEYEETYQNKEFMKDDLSGPYNSAGLFSSYNLTVTGTAYEDDDGIDGQRRYNINLHGVKAIHLGLWLKTTSAAGSGQCGDIASPGGQCAPPPPPTEATCTAL